MLKITKVSKLIRFFQTVPGVFDSILCDDIVVYGQINADAKPVIQSHFFSISLGVHPCQSIELDSGLISKSL